MSRALMAKLVGAAAATTAGLLIIAAPADAAPQPPAAAPASTAVASVAAAEDLPPNVTMTVIGELPELQGPMDYYVQDGPTTSGVSPRAAASLPFSFTLTGVRDLYGRYFRSTKTSVCTDIKVYYSDHGESSRFEVDLSGTSVRVPVDNVARSYCWSGVSTTKDLRFWYGFTDECGECTKSKVNGSGQVRYP